ncbi:hypothetical protein FN976_03885 [Caenimonas sedimenti]|uniref:Uncharacterized protein n=1 Tax=Caenimonas sedimenti TaxID=2596921 RepID=A0A562ZWD7_9BURK|nr:hypothetical protein [Caenimonas sedimenti]TWO72681.1 hypothetical protein FN976_03885 [Caenimonas sedimenti]
MIIGKTDEGHRVLRDRSVQLTPKQRAAFILIDGKKALNEVLAATAAGGVTRADIDKLMELGLVREVPAGLAAMHANAAKLEAKRSARTLEDRFDEAYPIATLLTAGLGLRNYRLKSAVEATTNYMDLLALAPRIREAVGDERFATLDRALND